MKVRLAKIEQMDEIRDIYAYARSFMASVGNPHQWGDRKHPSDEFIKSKIEDGVMYTIGDDDIQGVFVLIYGEDPTYKVIEGAWLNDEPYATVHAVASKEGAHGIFTIAINYAKSKYKNVRIDTHSDNKIMQHLIPKAGFSYCGIIYLVDGDGTPRLAYHYVNPPVNYEKYKLFVVDYDGTIISSMAMWGHMCSSFLLSKGFTLKEDVDKRAITQTNVETAQYMIDNYFPKMSINEMEDMMNAYVMESYVKNPLKPNAISLLKKMKSVGRVVLFSATAVPLLLASLKVLGIEEYFDAIYSASAMGVTKKDGSGYLEVLKIEGYSKENSLIVEDAPHACKGAKMVGLDVLGVEDTETKRHCHEVMEYSDYYLHMKEAW